MVVGEEEKSDHVMGDAHSLLADSVTSHVKNQKGDVKTTIDPMASGAPLMQYGSRTIPILATIFGGAGASFGSIPPDLTRTETRDEMGKMRLEPPTRY